MDYLSSSPSHGPLPWQAEDLFGDSRKFGAYTGPTRYARLPKATPDGGAFSYNRELKKLVVIGRESMFIQLES